MRDQSGPGDIGSGSAAPRRGAGNCATGHNAPADAQRPIAQRTSELARAFGDPHDPENPLSQRQFTAADERGEPSADGEALLDGFGLGAEYVPVELGGRLARLDGLVRVLREVFRRDVGLGLGHGVTSFMAAVNVWAAGSPEQRDRLGRLLLDGGKVSVAYHELAHGNDFLHVDFTARAGRGGYRLYGAKEVINNADRARAWVLFARTDPAPGSRSHSVLLAGPDEVPTDRWQPLPRYRTAGVRGCRISGLAFRDCPVPASALVGDEGRGGEVALRSFQVTRSALPGMAIGTADSCLRTVLRFALERRLYRRNVIQLPHAAAVLTNAFADLLLCDSLSLAAARTVHLLPEQASVTSAAVKYLVPKLLTDSVRELSVVLGARFYVREGEHAAFGRHVRDLPVLSLGHAGPTACLATLVPQLRRLATAPQLSCTDGLFTVEDDDVPAGIPFDRLTLAATGDTLTATLTETEAPVQDLLRDLAVELADVRRACRALPPAERTPLASPAAFALAARYAELLGAAAAVGVWRTARGGFLADPVWLGAALHRSARRLGLREGGLPAAYAEPLRAELLRRYEELRSFDLYDHA
ncbi:acyl-CoA dehydrogenase [Streptomyces sp. GESEQ-35]|uniref:acyl-CoA dehydrogenase n=1 Tax=Streptomyces sp. GESEQ-35 TaxID=2812657 RepID=UPI001B33ED3A|nr:acyl-CoA dehydrogenase [Streptomyces sp. GESEQ-35]